MDTIDRILIVFIVVVASSLFSFISHVESKKFTRNQVGKVYIDGKCLKMGKQ